jgi:hypothetical protein
MLINGLTGMPIKLLFNGLGILGMSGQDKAPTTVGITLCSELSVLYARRVSKPRIRFTAAKSNSLLKDFITKTNDHQP